MLVVCGFWCLLFGFVEVVCLLCVVRLFLCVGRCVAFVVSRWCCSLFGVGCAVVGCLLPVV